MAVIPDINETEEWILTTTLRERYDEEIKVDYADAEIRLNPADRELSLCPVIYWQHEGCNFVIFKTGDKNYRCQFFYKPYRQYNTGVREYTDLAECTVALLQGQADHVAKEKGDL